MLKQTLFLFLILAAAIHAGEKSFPITPIADVRSRGSIDFARDVLPILRHNCLACHSHQKPKADLDLEEPATMRKGGESGPALVAGKGEESLLIQVSCGKHADYYMPPAKNTVGANPLTPEELGILKLWIDQGANGSGPGAAQLVAWRPLPSGLNPIFAVDVSSDGSTAVCARANQIYLYDLAGGQLAARLADPQLSKEGFGNAADRDYIQSLAFSSDARVLASGGYRCIKLWRKQPLAQRMALNDPQSKAPVVALAVHSAGNRIAKGMADGRVEVWDALTGKQVWSVQAHTLPVQALVFAGDGSILISGSADRMIRIWHANGKLAGEIHAGLSVTALAFHDETHQLLSGGGDNSIRVWALPSTHDYMALPIKELKGHSNIVSTLEFIPGGKQLLSGGMDNGMIQWNFPEGNQIRRMDCGGPVSAIAANADGKRLACAGGPRLRMFNGENGQQLAEVRGDRAITDARAAAQRDVAFWKDEGEYVKTALQSAEKEQKAAQEALKKAEESKIAAEKDLVAKQEAQKKALTEKEQAQKVAADAAEALKKATEAKDPAVKASEAAAAESKSATEKATAAKAALDKSAAEKAAAEKAQGELQAKAAATDAKDKPTPEILKTASAKVETAKLAFDRDTANFAAADKDAAPLRKKAEELAAKRAAAEKVLAEATPKKNDTETKSKAAEKAFADADQALKNALAAKDAAERTVERSEALIKKAGMDIEGFKTAQSQAQAASKEAEERLDKSQKASVESEKAIRAVCAIPNSGLFAAGLEQGLLAYWGAERGTPGERALLSGPINAVRALDENRIVIAGDAGCFIWSARPAWILERTLGSNSEDSPISGRVEALNFSPDGKWLAAGSGVPSRSGEVKVFDVATGSVMREFKDLHSDTVYGVSFSADGKHLATCGADRFVRVLDMQSGKVIKTFEGHTHHALGVTWKRDGRTLASAGADRTIKVWDMVTGEQKKSIENGFRKEVTAVHFVPGQNALLCASGDNVLKIVKEDGTGDLRNFGGEKGFPQSTAISADGKIIVGGGDDSTLRVYDAEAKTLNTFEAPK